MNIANVCYDFFLKGSPFVEKKGATEAELKKGYKENPSIARYLPFCWMTAKVLRQCLISPRFPQKRGLPNTFLRFGTTLAGF